MAETPANPSSIGIADEKTAWQGGFLYSFKRDQSMTNIVPLDKSRGFTRMDNQLMDGLLAIDLPAREMKIVLYVAKATINFGAGSQRIPATDIAKAIHAHPDTVSKAISSLLRRRVLFREGGARGDIGVNDPNDWVYVIEPKQTKTADSAGVVRIGEESKQTKTTDCLLYSKNLTPYVSLPSEENTCPPATKSSLRPRLTVRCRSGRLPCWPTTRTAG